MMAHHGQFAGKLVLDLGCGPGLPGVIAAKCGATVHFQDYVGISLRCSLQNADVINSVTMANVNLNTSIGLFLPLALFTPYV